MNKMPPEIRLSDKVCAFLRAAETFDPVSSNAYMRSSELLYGLTAAIAQADQEGLTRDEILAVVDPARQVIGRSAFGQRLQVWPRGYPGDYDTVEWIVTQRNRSPPTTFACFVEEHALASAISQQHRNKIRFQADLIRRVCNASGRTDLGAKVLIVASGGALDLRSVADCPAVRRSRFVLNDSDTEALQNAADGIRDSITNVAYIAGNVFTVFREIAKHGPFDLIITGGLFDYLPDRAAILLIRQAFQRLLASGGTFYMSNIRRGNPYRVWMEYLENWFLIERTEDDLQQLMALAQAEFQDLEITVDASGLTSLLTARKTST